MVSTTPEPSRTRLRLRRDPRWLLAGILAIVLGGLATAFLFMSATSADPVLRVNRTVFRGERIKGSDLSVVTISRGLDVKSVPGSRLDDVVGSAAVTDIPAGSLLVDGAWGPATLEAGHSRLGVRLSSGRLPSSDLVPGTPVLVVALAAASGPATSEGELPASVAATLATAPISQPDGSWVVDVNVPTDRAETIARLAASDRVVVVRQGPAR